MTSPEEDVGMGNDAGLTSIWVATPL